MLGGPWQTCHSSERSTTTSLSGTRLSLSPPYGQMIVTATSRTPQRHTSLRRRASPRRPQGPPTSYAPSTPTNKMPAPSAPHDVRWRNCDLRSDPGIFADSHQPDEHGQTRTPLPPPSTTRTCIGVASRNIARHRRGNHDMEVRLGIAAGNTGEIQIHHNRLVFT